MGIKILVMDVDGTLTDGGIYVSGNGELMKRFNVKDGYAIAHVLPALNITPVIITGRRSEIVEYRCKELGIKHCYQGVSNKLETLKNLVNDMGISNTEVAYIGDDINDLECIKYCSYTSCPYDAADEVKNAVSYICKSIGGQGAVREFVDLLAKKVL